MLTIREGFDLEPGVHNMLGIRALFHEMQAQGVGHDSYDAVFDCPIEFNAKSMEWHFDANLLQEACPNANPVTADICQGFCQRVLNQAEEDLSLAQSIRVACLNSRGLLPTADAMAARLGMSVRTLHRRLSLLGQTYQGIVDDVRQSLAKEYLHGTAMSVDEIAHRIGFSETANFRRAFKKWTGLTPAQFRQN